MDRFSNCAQLGERISELSAYKIERNLERERERESVCVRIRLIFKLTNLVWNEMSPHFGRS